MGPGDNHCKPTPTPIFRGRHGGVEKGGGWKTSRMTPLPKISGLQKGPAERGHVKKRQKASKSFSTLFDSFRAGQKTSKIVKKCQKVFRHFSTIFARHHFSGPFWGALKKGVLDPPSYGTFSTPPQASALCFSCTKIHDRADQKLFWRGPRGTYCRHFYFSHRPSPLINSTLQSNTLHGVDFGSILGQTRNILVVNFHKIYCPRNLVSRPPQ